MRARSSWSSGGVLLLRARPLGVTGAVLVGLFTASVAIAGAQQTAYTNSSYGFTIQFPTGWTISEPGILELGGRQTNYAAVAQSEHAGISVIVVDLYSSSANSAQDTNFSRAEIDQHMEDPTVVPDEIKTILSNLQSATDFKLKAAEVGKLDGLAAAHVQYTDTGLLNGSDSKPLVVETYVVVRNGISFAISSYIERDYAPQIGNATAAALASFHVGALPGSVLQDTPKPKPPGPVKRFVSARGTAFYFAAGPSALGSTF